MNTHVDFETAKLLKEKGFDNITCTGYYFGTEDCINVISDKQHKTKDKCLAPTIAEVVMWLYDKHGIWIECLHRGDTGDFTFKCSKLKNNFRTRPHYIHSEGFNLPTEAYQEAITYTLT